MTIPFWRRVQWVSTGGYGNTLAFAVITIIIIIRFMASRIEAQYEFGINLGHAYVKNSCEINSLISWRRDGGAGFRLKTTTMTTTRKDKKKMLSANVKWNGYEMSYFNWSERDIQRRKKNLTKTRNRIVVGIRRTIRWENETRSLSNRHFGWPKI